RSREESRHQFASIGAAAAVELGNRTQGRLWARLEPLWIGALSVSTECLSPSRFVCPERSSAASSLDWGDLSSNPRSRPTPSRIRPRALRGFQLSEASDFFDKGITIGSGQHR